MARKAESKKKKPKVVIAKGATENGPRGSGIWDKLKKPFSLVLCHRLIALAVMRNGQVSHRAGLIEQRKHLRGQLAEKQTPAEFNKLAGKLLHLEADIKTTKAQEKAALEDMLRLTLDSVGGDLFQAPDEDEAKGPQPDEPGQLRIGEPDFKPDELPVEGQRITITARKDFDGKPKKSTGIVTSVNDRTGAIILKPDNTGAFEVPKLTDNYKWHDAA